jgi:hypothetical protein
LVVNIIFCRLFSCTFAAHFETMQITLKEYENGGRIEVYLFGRGCTSFDISLQV